MPSLPLLLLLAPQLSQALQAGWRGRGLRGASARPSGWSACAGRDEAEEGMALFRPYRPGEEGEVEVADSSKRLFALVLGVPIMATLVGIATYNPTAQELEDTRLKTAQRLRGGSALLRLRGGMSTTTSTSNIGRWLLDAALASPIYKLFLVPQAKAMMVRTAEDNGVPWQKARTWIESRGPWALDAKEQEDLLTIPEYYRQPFHSYEEGNLCWDAAHEVEIASRAVGARNMPAHGADGDLAFRAAFDDALESIGASVPDGGTALDIGCGTGISTRRIAARFPKAARVIGLDLSPHFIQVGQKLTRVAETDGTEGGAAWQWVNRQEDYLDPRVELRWGAAEATGFEDNSVDVINVGLVIHELPPEATVSIMREAHRVLKVGGQLWITEMDFDTPGFKNLRANPVLFSFIRSTEPYLDEYADYQSRLPQDLVGMGFDRVTLTAATGRHFALVATKGAGKGEGVVDDRRAETQKADTHLKTWESRQQAEDSTE